MIRITEFEETPFHSLRYRTSGRKGRVLDRTLPFHRAKATGLGLEERCLVLTADLQGREASPKNRLLGEAVAEELQLLVELSEIPAVDTAILAGDLFEYDDCRKRGGTGDVSAVWQAFAQVANAVVGVNGNHDVFSGVPGSTDGITLLDGNTTSKGSIRIAGVSGIIGDPKRHQRRWESEYLSVLESTLQRHPELLILHQGPDDPVNQRLGSSGVRSLLVSGYPALTVFGHTHWDAPIIVNVGAGQAVNVDGRVLVVTED